MITITLINCESVAETKKNSSQDNNITVIEKKKEDIKNKEKNTKEKHKTEEEIKIEENKETTPKIIKIVIKEAPNWYNSPPSSELILYTTGMAKSTNMQFALDKASDWAKQSLAIIIEKKVHLVTKNFFENSNIDQKELYTELLNQFSRKVSLNALSALRIKERDVKAIGNYFAAFSLIELSLTNLSKNIDDALKFYGVEFSELKLNKSIIELLNELKKLRSGDFITE